MFDAGILAKFSQPRLNTTYLQAAMGSVKRNKQDKGVVFVQFEIYEQVHLGLNIGIDPLLLVTLAMDYAFTRIEIYIPPV